MKPKPYLPVTEINQKLTNSGNQTIETLPGTVRILRALLAELTRTLGQMKRALERQSSPQKLPTPSATITQPKGRFVYELFDQEFSVRNGTDVMVSVLRHFAKLDPEFPERFS